MHTILRTSPKFGAFVFDFLVQTVRADLAVETTEPRQFGYVLGDKIERIFVVESAKKVQLNKEKLKLGRIDTWFSVVNLRDLGVSSNKPKFSLTYQVINVPEAPSMVEIASRTIDVIADGKPKAIQGPKTPCDNSTADATFGFKYGWFGKHTAR